LGLDHHTAGTLVRIGLQFLHLSHQQDHLQKIVDSFALQGRHRDEDRIAPPFLGNEAVLGQLLLHPIRVSFRLVDFVHRHNNGNIRRFRMVDRLNGLGHHSVIGGHHQYGDVRHLGAAGAHGGKGGVSGSIQKGDLLPAGLHLVCTDMLSNPSRLRGGNFGLANRIQQRGFSVVHVTHDRHHGRPLLQILRSIRLLDLFEEGLVDLFLILHRHTELFRDQGNRVHVDFLVDGGHHSETHQLFDHFRSFLPQALGQFSHCEGSRDFQLRRQDGSLLLTDLRFLILFPLAPLLPTHRSCRLPGTILFLRTLRNTVRIRGFGLSSSRAVGIGRWSSRSLCRRIGCGWSFSPLLALLPRFLALLFPLGPRRMVAAPTPIAFPLAIRLFGLCRLPFFGFLLFFGCLRALFNIPEELFHLFDHLIVHHTHVVVDFHVHPFEDGEHFLAAHIHFSRLVVDAHLRQTRPPHLILGPIPSSSGQTPDR